MIIDLVMVRRQKWVEVSLVLMLRLLLLMFELLLSLSINRLQLPYSEEEIIQGMQVPIWLVYLDNSISLVMCRQDVEWCLV